MNFNNLFPLEVLLNSNNFMKKLKLRYPTNPSLDTTALFSRGCDAVVFLVFNQFAADCETPVDGHKYAGVNKVSYLGFIIKKRKKSLSKTKRFGSIN